MMTPPASIALMTANLRLAHPPVASLAIDIGGFVIAIESNSNLLLDQLRRYFTELVVASPSARPDIELRAFQTSPVLLSASFRDWPREPGKTSRKEAFADVEDGRVVLKVRTGMQFLLGRSELVAVGPCTENSNQVINFVISQYISRRLHEGWVLCHSAGVAYGAPGLAPKGLAIAARAGAGKSTLALHLMSTGLSFVSNDRVLIRRDARGPLMAGVPKMPRVNPGTLLNNPALVGILPPGREQEIRKMSPREIWELEEKYDVLVDQVYGPRRSVYRTPISALLVLNWHHSAEEPTRFQPVPIGTRPDLLDLVMKSPGVFHRDALGQSGEAALRLDPAPYVAALDHVRVFEATGKADFEYGVGFCRALLEAP
jgi:HprK-related kinase B